jgi:hypothetical protein
VIVMMAIEMVTVLIVTLMVMVMSTPGAGATALE